MSVVALLVLLGMAGVPLAIATMDCSTAAPDDGSTDCTTQQVCTLNAGQLPIQGPK